MNIMKNGALFLLIILISGLILAPFLGGKIKEGYTDAATSYANAIMASGVSKADNADSSKSANSKGYDNYDHYSKSSAPTVFYGPNGSKANVMKDSTDFYIIVTGSNGETISYSTKVPVANSTSASTATAASAKPTTSDSISSLMKQFNNTTFYGPNGGSARFFTGNDGQYAIEATKANGDTTIYTATNTYTYNYGSQSSSYSASPFLNPFASSKPSSTSADPASSNSANTSGMYDTSLPQGIPKSMIPRGQEDLYILKSEIVPPVCPACPSASVCPTTGKKEKCPPCPACARCPEPSFECKKVPNYNSAGNYGSSSGYGRSGGSYDATGNFNSSTGGPGYLPVPVLSDFSTF
jgi:uncharacterized protein (UPF0333 family)